MKLSSKHILVHIAGWFFYFLITLLVFSDPEEELFSFLIKNEVSAMIVSFLLLMVCFFYVNRIFLIPDLFFPRKYFFYGISVFTFISILITVPLFMRQLFVISEIRAGLFLINQLLSTALLFMMVFVASSTGPLVKRWIAAENSAVELENQRLSAELSFLKSQINPHFLFNTLNNIYSLSVSNNPAASESILKLSQLLRYLLQGAKSDSVSIDKEIEHLNQYIDLQKLRLTKMVLIEFKVDMESSHFKIAPLLLLPFLENAFKYGVSTRELSKIEIEIKFKNSVFEFIVKNPLNAGDLMDLESTGIGVENVKRRLDLSYPDNYQLLINNGIVSHRVHLIITGLC